MHTAPSACSRRLSLPARARFAGASLFACAALAGASLLACAALAGAARATISYGLPLAVTPGGLSPSATAVADVNADGHADIVWLASDLFASPLTTLLGAGDGTFASVPAGITVGAIFPLQALEDVDGDGLPDLLVRNLGSVPLALHPGLGDGTFGAPLELTTSLSTELGLLQVARPVDLGGGALRDLVLVTGEDAPNGIPARVWVVDFDGADFAIVETHDVPADPRDLVVGDLDDDGLSDVAVSLVDGTVRVFTADGAGGLDAGAVLAAGGFGGDAALADLDADGALDVLVVASGEIAVFGGQGDGTFVPAAPVPTPASTILLGDADGDGAPDLFASRFTGAFPNLTNELDAHRGFCDGTFGTPVTVVATGQALGGLASADFDEDGRDDVVVIPANEFVSVATSTSDGPTYVGLGGGLAGATISSFDARGALVAGEPFCWTLVDALPGAGAFLVVGSSELAAPFKGGTLVPTPTLVIPGLIVGADGRLALGGTFASLTIPFDVLAQFWYLDAAGPAGFAASPGVQATVP